MASKSAKKDGKKDDELPAASMAALAKLLPDHKTALSAELKSALTSLKTKLDRVQAAISDHGQRVTSLEDNANLVSDRFEEMEAKYTTLEDSFAKLKAKTIDLESRSWHNNIQIAGVPESPEGTQPTTVFSKLLLEIFWDEVLSSPPELDRANRALTAKLPGGKPRLVIARIHNYRVKEKIIQEAKKRRGKLFYQGNPVDHGAAHSLSRGDVCTLPGGIQTIAAVPSETQNYNQGRWEETLCFGKGRGELSGVTTLKLTICTVNLWRIFKHSLLNFHALAMGYVGWATNSNAVRQLIGHEAGCLQYYWHYVMFHVFIYIP